MNTRLRVKSGGADINVRIDGDASLPWIVLSNSLATNLAMWDDQIEALTGIRRVLRYDTRGHGGSGAPGGPYDFATLCGDVIAIMDEVGIASADVLGLSLGGMTALGLALDHAERVNRVICCCARGDFPAPVLSAWDERIDAVARGGTQAIAEATLGRWFTEPTHKNRPAVVERARGMILSTSANGYCGCAAALKRLDYRQRLPTLTKSVLYLAGEADGAASPDAMRDMAGATPGAVFAEIPGVAHIANMEDAGRFNAIIRAFL